MNEKFVAEFFNKVNEMREEQKKYFRTRNPEVLANSKKLEKEVDELLIEVRSGQIRLFN